MKKLLQFLMTMYLSIAMVGCYSTEEPVGPDVPIVGALKLSQEEMTVGADGGEFSVDIFTEYAYETSTNVDWITISGGSCGTEYCTLYFTVEKNDTTSEREGVITVFCDNYNLSATLTVSQEAGENTGDTIPNNEIWYTSSDGEVVTPKHADVFGANIVSNTYEEGKGIIEFDGKITTIGKSAFYSKSTLATIAIPNSVTSIGDFAFHNCNSLTNVIIPNSVTSIGEYAFQVCSSLSSVTIPESVTEIGAGAYGHCNNLNSFYGKFASEDNRCLVVNGVLVSFAVGCGVTEYTIPNNVTVIGDYAFCNCSSLVSITIPNDVTSIERDAFQNCSISSITIPDSVTTIKWGAFRNCNISSITIPDSVTSIEGNPFTGCPITAFYGKFATEDHLCLIANGELVSFAVGCNVTEYTIQNGVSSIGIEAFAGCKNLKNVIIPNGVSSIGQSAFSSCNSLTGVAISDSVTSIGASAFMFSKLSTIVIPDGVTAIEYRTFYRCSRLSQVTIGEGVKSIGDGAFSYCNRLENVYCKPTNPPEAYDSIFSSESVIYVPHTSVETYKTAQYWSNYASNIVGYNF